MQESGRDMGQERLMEQFLGAIEPLSPQEAEEATGISWMSVTNYRKGEWKRLTARIQRQMRAYLERVSVAVAPTADAIAQARMDGRKEVAVAVLSLVETVLSGEAEGARARRLLDAGKAKLGRGRSPKAGGGSL